MNSKTIKLISYMLVSIWMCLGFLVMPVRADVHGDDSRKDPICYDEATGTSAFTRTSKAVGSFFNSGTMWDPEAEEFVDNQFSKCSAFLISPDNLFITSSHCLATDSTRHDVYVVFGGQSVDCNSTTVTELKTYPSLELIDDRPELDMALFRIIGQDPAVADGFGWLELDPNTRLSEIWGSPGFGEGTVTVGGQRTIFIPTSGVEEDLPDHRSKVAWDADCVVTDVPADCDVLKALLDAKTPDYYDIPSDACFYHSCDATKGSSGAPILDTPSVKVIGLNYGKDEAVKIRSLWPYISHLIDYRDTDGDRLPDIRDNCPFVPNTGRCTAGKAGFINCLSNSDCDSGFSAGDGICEGSQTDFDRDGIGDVCEELPPDQFDQAARNDSPLQAATVNQGSYALTIQDRSDEDYFRYIVPVAYNNLIISVNANADQGFRELGFDIRYRDCDTCPEVLAPARQIATNTAWGWRYEESYVPAGRSYEIHVFELGQNGPVNYRMTIGATDRFEPNNTLTTATDWTPPGCDFTGTLNLANDSDVDFYRISGVGASIEAQIYVESGRTIELYLDGDRATEVSDTGTEKKLRIKGCGKEPSVIEVRGLQGSYDLCIARVPIEASCELVQDFIPFAGDGYFQFRITNPYSPVVTESVVPVNKRMFARLITETPASVTWEILGTVEYGKRFNQLFRGQMAIPRPNPGTPLSFGPLSSGSPLLFEAQGRVAWYQVPPTGQGEAIFAGPDNAVETFNVISSGLRWNASLPQDVATLVIHAGRDSDRDGIRDDVEIETGTDPNNPDTDGDGLLDGTEDANGNGFVDAGETDPRLFDSDGDGLSDGLEAGLGTSEGTSVPLTARDEDYYTYTDPTKNDTDGDGLPDGIEDANHNGRVDPGETSPLLRDVIVPAPDLIIESLGHSPASPTTLSTLIFTVVVKNAGTIPAGPSTLNFKVGGETFGQDFNVPGLAPGDRFTVQRQEVLGIAQNYRNTAIADSKNEVAEGRENNNQKTDDYTVVLAGNLDGDNDVDQNDLNMLLSFRNQPASACPSCDLDGDGMITALDSRKLVLLCTRPRCATQ